MTTTLFRNDYNDADFNGDTELVLPDMLWYRSRSLIKTLAKREITKLLENGIDISNSSTRCSNIRTKLNNHTVISENWFGDVYKADIIGRRHIIPVVVKESFLTDIEQKSTRSDRHSYSEDFRILSWTNQLLDKIKCPNFLFSYDTAECECKCDANDDNEQQCIKDGNKIKACYVSFYEPADIPLSLIINQLTDAEKQSITYQLFTALHSLQKYYVLLHGSINPDTILIKYVRSGGCIEYIVNGDMYVVKNVGIIPFLTDFGDSKSFSPVYSGNSKYISYGTRNAIVQDNNLIPIKCKYSVINGEIINAPLIHWNDGSDIGISSTNNHFDSISVNLQPSIPIDLNNGTKYPPFEFFYDIQDLVITIIGSHNSNHKSFVRRLQQILKIDHFPYTINDSVKYLLADYALKSIYLSDEPNCDNAINSFSVS